MSFLTYRPKLMRNTIYTILINSKYTNIYNNVFNSNTAYYGGAITFNI